MPESLMNRILVAGASRGVGREIARLLVNQGYSVTGFTRSESIAPELQALGLETVIVDALDAQQVEAAMNSFDAVISTIGSLPQDGKLVDYEGNQNLIDAAIKANVKKFILVSSIGAGESAVALPPQALETLKTVLVEKEKAEQYLIKSGLTSTIVRPGGLKSEPPTGNAVLTEDPKIAGSINRADVADLVCRCLTSDRANQKILSAIDRNMLYGTASFEEFIP